MGELTNEDLEKFSVPAFGLEVLDTQHELLWEKLKKVLMIVQGDDRSRLYFAFSDFVDYTKFHCRTEQTYMTKADYPKHLFLGHQKAFEDVFVILDGLELQINKDENAISEDTVFTIMRGVIAIVVGHDKPFVSFLKKEKPMHFSPEHKKLVAKESENYVIPRAGPNTGDETRKRILRRLRPIFVIVASIFFVNSAVLIPLLLWTPPYVSLPLYLSTFTASMLVIMGIFTVKTIACERKRANQLAWLSKKDARTVLTDIGELFKHSEDSSDVELGQEDVMGRIQFVLKFSHSSFVKMLFKAKQTGLFNFEREIACLFLDLESFTTLTESLESKQLCHLMRQFFEATSYIEECGGVINKYLGDAVLALWNVPEYQGMYEVTCVSCALRLKELVDNIEYVDQNGETKTLKCRIGINSGNAVVGTFGSCKRLSFEVFGDVINVAARLESLNKEFGTSIIVSDVVKRSVSGMFTLRFLDVVLLKGKKTHCKVYEVLSRELESIRENRESAKSYEKLSQPMMEKNWDETVEILDGIIKDDEEVVENARQSETKKLLKKVPARVLKKRFSVVAHNLPSLAKFQSTIV